MIKCPNCGAGMYFDIREQLLICRYCDSRISAEEYEADINAQEINGDSAVFLCKSCGAQLMVPGNQATAFCPYCGNQSMIMSTTGSFEANKIIPFKKTREDIEKIFESYLRGKLFVPADYKNHTGVNSFRGIYIPHYNYTVGFKPGTMFVESHRDFDEGNKHHHMTFTNEVTTGGGESSDIVRDASAAFDDNLAAAIAPYTHSEAEPFREGYLGDFYADIPSVEPEIYDEQVTGEAVDELKEEIEKSCIQRDMKFDYDSKELAGRVEEKDVRADLYPVWFMTRRMKNNRVAYAVANGQTGKMAMDLPVSRSKFFIGVSIITVILFALFSAVFGFMTPPVLTGICSVVSACSLIVLTVCAFLIHRREGSLLPSDDKTGKLMAGVSEKKSKLLKKAKSIASASSMITVMLLSFYAVGILRTFGASLNLPAILAGAALAAGIIAFIALLLLIHRNETFNLMLINGFSAVITLAVCMILIVRNPFNDLFYVGASLLSLLTVIVNCLSVIALFDRLCTHPAPDFYTRKGATHDEN